VIYRCNVLLSPRIVPKLCCTEILYRFISVFWISFQEQQSDPLLSEARRFLTRIYEPPILLKSSFLKFALTLIQVPNDANYPGDECNKKSGILCQPLYDASEHLSPTYSRIKMSFDLMRVFQRSIWQ
jgi:hypothetical protein